MSNEIQNSNAAPMSAIEKVVVGNDLSALTPPERWQYYCWRCESLGLDPSARPFQYISFNGKLGLYADKGCAEQLRAKHKINTTIGKAEVFSGIYTVQVTATAPDGRTATDIGAVNIEGIRGDALAKAMKVAVTQGNRRATLSLLGLGSQDVEEVEGATRLDVEAVHDPKGLLPTDNKPEQTITPHAGPISWSDADTWPPGDAIEADGKVTAVSIGERGAKKWLKVTMVNGDKEINLTTWHMSAEAVLRAAIGKDCTIFYAPLEKTNRLLSIKDYQP